MELHRHVLLHPESTGLRWEATPISTQSSKIDEMLPKPSVNFFLVEYCYFLYFVFWLLTFYFILRIFQNLISFPPC